MSRQKEVRDALASFAAQFGPHQTLTYTVVSVDEEGMTCDVVDEDDLEHLLRLAPIVTSGQSVVQYPAAGKKVLAARFEDSGDWYVSWAEQYYKTVITIGACVLETDGERWTIRNGSANLKDVLARIIESVQVIVVMMGNNPDYEKLTEAQTLLDQLLQ